LLDAVKVKARAELHLHVGNRDVFDSLEALLKLAAEHGWSLLLDIQPDLDDIENLYNATAHAEIIDRLEELGEFLPSDTDCIGFSEKEISLLLAPYMR